MFGIGVQELAIVFVIALLVFGPKRLPELARTMGKGLAEFRRASSDLRQSLNFDLESEGKTAPPVTPPRPAQAGDLELPTNSDAAPDEAESDDRASTEDSGNTEDSANSNANANANASADAEADARGSTTDESGPSGDANAEGAREKSPVASGD